MVTLLPCHKSIPPRPGIRGNSGVEIPHSDHIRKHYTTQEPPHPTPPDCMKQLPHLCLVNHQ